MKSRLTFMVLFLIIGTAFLYSNPGAYSTGSGGTLTPFKSETVYLKEEKIIITVDMIKYSPHHIGGCFEGKYECSFILKNTSNESKKITIGFPIKFGRGTGSKGNDNWSNLRQKGIYGNNDIKEMTIRFDGKNIDYKIATLDNKSELLGNNEYDIAYYFDIQFKSNEEKEIKILYIQDLGFNDYSVNYVLKSGKTWSKPIESAIISVNFNFPVNIRSNNIQEDCEFHDFPFYSIKYKKKNFVPSDDLQVSFYPKARFPANTISLLKSIMKYSTKMYNDDKRLDFYFNYEYYVTKYIDFFTNENLKKLKHTFLTSYGYTGKDEKFYNIIEKKFINNLTRDKIKNNPFNYNEELLYFYNEYKNSNNLTALNYLYDLGVYIIKHENRDKILNKKINKKIISDIYYEIGDFYLNKFDLSHRIFNIIDYFTTSLVYGLDDVDYLDNTSYFAHYNLNKLLEKNLLSVFNKKNSDVVLKLAICYLKSALYLKNEGRIVNERDTSNIVSRIKSSYFWYYVYILLTNNLKIVNEQKELLLLKKIDRKLFQDINNKKYELHDESIEKIKEFIKTPKQFVVSVNNLRLREKPTTSSDIIRNLKKNEVIIFISKDKPDFFEGKFGNWIKCKTKNNEIGYCFDLYIRKLDD